MLRGKGKDKDKEQQNIKKKVKIEIPSSLYDRVLEIIEDEEDKQEILDWVEFKPIAQESLDDEFVPTYVFIITESELKPFPAKQTSSNELVIDYQEDFKKEAQRRAKKLGKAVDMDELKKTYFVGVPATILTLPREFLGSFSSVALKKLPKSIHARVFAMYWGEPFVRNFFTMDICDKPSKWKALVHKGIAIPSTDSKAKWGYEIKEEFLITTNKPVYDISSFNFIKAEFFEVKMSELIRIAIAALYEEFERKPTSVFWLFFGFLFFLIIENIVILWFLKDTVAALNPRPIEGAASIIGKLLGMW